MKTKLFKWMTVIAVACMTSSVWADGVDVTDKLVNADGEDRLQGWAVDFTIEEGFKGYTWASNSHTERAYYDEGYWGMKGRIFELWNNNQTIPGPTSIYQDLTGLPNGTYVFGAFSLGVHSGYDASDPEDYLQSQGVYLFANTDEVPVATNAPSSTYSWGHGRKVNVATTVTDGTLRVGMELKENPTAFWAAFDNATLYYFGDATAEAALTEMRKIDIDFDITVTDTLKKYDMSAECYADLESAAEFGRAATQLAEYEAADDSIRVSCMRARRSISDFQKLIALIATAKDVAAGEWSEAVKEQVRLLNATIVKMESGIKNHAIGNDQVAECMDKLTYDMDMVRVDQLWTVLDQLEIFLWRPEEISEDEPCFGITEHPGFGDEAGQYSLQWQDKLSALYEETNELLADIEVGAASPSDGFAQVGKVEGEVANCIKNANKKTELPCDLILIPSESDPSVPYTSNSGQNDPYIKNNYYLEEGLTGAACIHVESPVINLDTEIDMLQIYVRNGVDTDCPAPNDGPFFSIAEFYLYDGDGNLIELEADDVSLPAVDPSYPASNMLDRQLSTFTHSRWASGVENYGSHYFTIRLPEPLSSFSFAYEHQWGGRVGNCPTLVTVDGMNAAEGDLSLAITNATQYNFTYGFDPGFYSEPNGVFVQALENAKAVLADVESSTADYIAAYEALNQELEKREGMTFNQPEPGKEYTISCKYSGYLSKQNKMKALSVMQDTIAWWEDADPANKYQRWTFEPAENTWGDDEVYYYIKNAMTGTYLGTYHNESGFDENGEAFSWSGSWYVKMSDEPMAWRLSNIGSGQFNLMNYCLLKGEWLTLHTDSHNNGNPSTKVTNHVGMAGICGVLVYWGDQSVNGYSSWAINEMETLPLTALVGNGATDKCYHFSTGSNAFTFTADKACAFTGFKMLDECYSEIAIQTKQTANVLTVTLPKVYADFYFSFDNDEGVQNVTINVATGEKTKLDLLQEAYDAADKEYMEGTSVGCIKDLSAYDKAMADAENLLENGGTDDEIVAAIAAIDAAMEGLEYIQPQAGNRYFIFAAYANNVSKFGGEAAMCYFNSLGMPGWSLFKNSDDFVWEFIPAETEGQWYLKNVASGLCLNYPTGSSDRLEMSETGVPYELIPAVGGSVNLHCLAEGNNATWCIHQLGWNGSQAFHAVSFWEDHEASRWCIREYNDVVSVGTISAEPATVRPEGIFDLFGRRVAAPEKGLYIVDGKKVLYR